MPCERREVGGATQGMQSAYNEVVEIQVVFKDPSGRTATVPIVFCVMEGLAADLLLGCPTLDRLWYGSTRDSIELRAYDIEIPSVVPQDLQNHSERVAVLTDSVIIHSAEMRELWVPTNADPDKEWVVRGAPHLPAEVVVAEGPAKIQDGRVKVFVSTRTPDAEVALGTFETIAELHEPTEADREDQRTIRSWRVNALRRNSEAFG
eukprot:1933845-Pyramimonas_sp.AAC.1